jgi:hypothetical protein
MQIILSIGSGFPSPAGTNRKKEIIVYRVPEFLYSTEILVLYILYSLYPSIEIYPFVGELYM